MQSLPRVLIYKLLPFFCSQTASLPQGKLILIGAHTRHVAIKGAFVLSTALFLKILGNILKKYLLFRLEHTPEWEYTSVFWRRWYTANLH